MDTFCFYWNEFILIDESERSVYMNTKYSDGVDVSMLLIRFNLLTCAGCMTILSLSHTVLKSTLDIDLLCVQIRQRPAHELLCCAAYFIKQ